MSFAADRTQSTGTSLAAHLRPPHRRSQMHQTVSSSRTGHCQKITTKQVNEMRNRFRRVLRFHHYQEMNQRMQENTDVRAEYPPPAVAADDDDGDEDIMMLNTDDEDNEELEARCLRKLAITQQAVEGDEDDDEWMDAMKVDVVPLDTADNTFDHCIEFEGEEDEKEEEEVEGALMFASDVSTTTTPTKTAYSNLSWERRSAARRPTPFRKRLPTTTLTRPTTAHRSSCSSGTTQRPGRGRSGSMGATMMKPSGSHNS